MKIAIQGVAGAFHDEAARKFFGQDIELEECSTFVQLCKNIDEGVADFGVMAIENTIAGSLLQNYGYLSEFRLSIIGEIYLRIKMNLMVIPGIQLHDVEAIYSHPIALRQCSEFLFSLPSTVRVIEAADTAEAAKLIAENTMRNSAAIAGVRAAELYGLEILKEGIETEKKNYTRFIALSKENKIQKETNKASLAFEVRHQPGSLIDALGVFVRNNINLTKIQSVPILGKPYQYAFHIDVEWDNRENYDKALSEFLHKVAGLSIYGEYKKGEIPTSF